MNAALGSSVWPSSSSSFSSSPSLLLSCFCNCNGSLTTRHQASSSNNNDRSRFWKLSSSQSTSLLASRTRRHSHRKSFFSPYRQGLIQSCAGKTPPSPSPSPELTESEMSMAKERKQLGGGGLLEKKDDGAIVVERLFSNLNEATLEHEPGELKPVCFPHKVFSLSLSLVPVFCVLCGNELLLLLLVNSEFCFTARLRVYLYCCCGGWCKQTGSLSSAVLLIAGTTVHPSLIPLHFLSANLLHVIVILNCCFFCGILLSSSEKRRFFFCWKIIGSGSCCEQEGFALGNFLFFSIL